jgi:hypothetical protein
MKESTFNIYMLLIMIGYIGYKKMKNGFFTRTKAQITDIFVNDPVGNPILPYESNKITSHSKSSHKHSIVFEDPDNSRTEKKGEILIGNRDSGFNRDYTQIFFKTYVSAPIPVKYIYDDNGNIVLHADPNFHATLNKNTVKFNEFETLINNHNVKQNEINLIRTMHSTRKRK